jgi:GNAT superfamily N-acetyltransferase
VIATCFELPAFTAEWLAGIPERPGWTCVLAFDEEEPATAGGVFTSAGAGWMTFGATLPEHRRKGGQLAVFAERVRAAAEAGCATLLTETGDAREGEPGPSYRNILRAGFERAYVRPNYRAPA